MRLASEAGDEFQLLILRYQYPDVHEDRWDSNWLMVTGLVSAGQEKWRFTEPCVTTFELADFAEWLEHAQASEPRDPVFEFTEPNLKFTYVATEQPAIRVTFAHESAPPSLTSEEDRRAGATVDFPLAGLDAVALAREIREALRDYPVRGGAA